MYPVIEVQSAGTKRYGIKDFGCRLAETFGSDAQMESAAAYAFIFYNSSDEAICQVLDDRSTLMYLDRLTGKDFHVFFLDTNRSADIDSFNNRFLGALGVEPPCALPSVVLFRRRHDDIVDVKVIESLPSHNSLAFHELCRIFSLYVENSLPSGSHQGANSNSWLPWIGKTVAQEAVRMALREVLGPILHKS
jgi:hypothetical protein